jgi:hypothetical protein
MVDPWKNVLSLFLAIPLAKWCGLYTGCFLSISSLWLGPGSCLHFLSLDLMTALHVTSCMTKPVYAIAHLNPDAEGSMFL